MNNRKGFISVVLAVAIVMIAIYGLIRVMSSTKKASTQTTEFETSLLGASAKLYDLMNLSYTDGLLTAGVHSEAAPSPYSWNIDELEVNRLKRITVFSNLRDKNAPTRVLAESPTVVGYRYNDF